MHRMQNLFDDKRNSRNRTNNFVNIKLQIIGFMMDKIRQIYASVRIAFVASFHITVIPLEQTLSSLLD